MSNSADILRVYLTLRGTPGIGNVTIAKLIRAFGSITQIPLDSPAELIKHLPTREANIMKKIKRFELVSEKLVNEQLSAMEKSGARIIPLGSSDYPALLSKIKNPPPVLFAIGEYLPQDRNAIAIVGTRKASAYGRNITKIIVEQLAIRGYTIVSGFAQGIDSSAQEAAIAFGGRTIAVLGCGVDVIYPKTNAELYEKVKRKGVIFSEQLMGAAPIAGYFPPRNRIISGLSLGTLVVEAGARSGALITARDAYKQKRRVYAIPGSLFSDLSKGPHRMIKGGAVLVESAADIIKDLKGKPPVPSDDGKLDNRTDKKRPIKKHSEQSKTSIDTLPPPASVLAPNEKLVYNALLPNPRAIEELTRQLDIPPQGLFPVLLNLEIKGLVERLPGNRFVKLTQ